MRDDNSVNEVSSARGYMHEYPTELKPLYLCKTPGLVVLTGLKFSLVIPVLMMQTQADPRGLLVTQLAIGQVLG